MFCKKEITLEEQCTVKFVPFFLGNQSPTDCHCVRDLVQ